MYTTFKMCEKKNYNRLVNLLRVVGATISLIYIAVSAFVLGILEWTVNQFWFWIEFIQAVIAP